jgi:uncharacterized membrane protein
MMQVWLAAPQAWKKRNALYAGQVGQILTEMLIGVEIFSFVIVCKRKEGVVFYQRASVRYVMLAVALP